MKKVLITGGTGFVGSNLVRRMLQLGNDVTLLVRPSFNNWRIKDIASDVQTHAVDSQDFEALKKIVSRIKPDWVFHTAVYGAYSHQDDMLQMIDTNIRATACLLKACMEVGFESFVNTGSTSEYGFKDQPAKEDDPLVPNSVYSVTKASATLLCQYIARSKNAAITTLRLFSVYGPYEEPIRLIPTLIIKGTQKEWPPLVSPDTAHDMVYVDDVIDAYLASVSRKSSSRGEIYNVASGRQIQMREIVATVGKVFNIKTEPTWKTMPDRIWDSKTWQADVSKIKADLKWAPTHSFQQGFEKTVDWLKSQPQMLDFYRNQREKFLSLKNK